MRILILSLFFTGIFFNLSAQRSMSFFNETDETITAMYISMVDTELWGESVLEASVAPGAKATIQFPYCEDYNIKIEAKSGKTCKLDQVYICTDHVEDFSNNWLGCFVENNKK